MIKRIKNYLATFFVGILLALPMMPLAAVHAQSSSNCLNGTGGTIASCLNEGGKSTDPNATGGTASDRVDNTIRLVILIFSWVVGIVSVIMIIIGGFKYITSGGEASNITGAKNTILYAIIGLVIVALAQVIVQFVLEKATTP